jgi:Fic family protein
MKRLLDPRILHRLSQSLEILNRKRPLNFVALKKIRTRLSIEMTYHSNAIEGNRLTLKETLLVLSEGITVKGKNLQEHLEAKNHEEAMHFLFALIDSKKRINFSNHLIRQLHQLIVKDTEKNIAGKYRNTDVRILGSKHQPPAGYQVALEMEKFVGWLSKNSSRMHPVELAVIAHHRFVAIHPFADGNGSTGRLLMNLILMKKGYPIGIILKNDRQKYYAALDQADRGNLVLLARLVAQAVERTFSIYLESTSKSSPQTESIVLSKLAEKSDFSAKYLNLLARSGLLNARKEGRNWYSSVKDLEDYKKNRIRKRY